MAEYDSAERTEQESHAEGREGREGPDDRPDVGEEDFLEDQSRHDAVEQKVVPFDNCSEEASEGRTACLSEHRRCLVVVLVHNASRCRIHRLVRYL